VPVARMRAGQPVGEYGARQVRVLDLSRYAFGVSAAVAVLTSCGERQQLPTGPQEAMPQRVGRSQMSSYRIVHSFGFGSDGSSPIANLIAVKGTLYGTTAFGGAYSGGEKDGGTVFSLSTTGKERVLHSFGKGEDGVVPSAGLLDVNGTLYGTTLGGGAHRGGTVFSIDTTGANYRILYNFWSSNYDGFQPLAGLVNVNGTLYGTTSGSGGATPKAGTIFSISTSGGYYRILHYFGKGHDGRMPTASLIDVNGTLYGTTMCGGAYGTKTCEYYGRGGTVFRFEAAGGGYKVVHSFGKPLSDGSAPFAGLIAVDGTLYGTTSAGGSSKCYYVRDTPCGTIFSIAPDGKERVVYSFDDSVNGPNPGASLVDVKGSLYGTTYNGAADNSGGTLFRIGITGSNYRVLHQFGHGHDGVGPVALLELDGALYGTTTCGGAYGAEGTCLAYPSYGLGGTVFELTP
jgi:uncharacterized repeat protein (TIGR03803 family)